MPLISKKDSNTLWVMKGLALLSVFYAHMPWYGGIVSDLRNVLGTIGVPIYFFLSGYLFKKPQKGDVYSFFIKKMTTIVIPWIICSTSTFLLSMFTGNRVDIIMYFKWVLGVHTWYYFVPMILLCFALFSVFQSKVFCYAAMGASIISLALTEFGLLEMPQPLTNYLNVLNWVGYFAAGILLRTKERVFCVNAKKIIMSLLSFLGGTILFVVLPIEKTYWNIYMPLYVVICSIFLYCVSYMVSDVLWLNDVGKKSYFIYLIHMQFAGIISSKLSLPMLGDLEAIIKPIIAWIVVFLGVSVFAKILKFSHREKVGIFLGFRM